MTEHSRLALIIGVVVLAVVAIIVSAVIIQRDEEPVVEMEEEPIVERAARPKPVEPPPPVEEPEEPEEPAEVEEKPAPVKEEPKLVLEETEDPVEEVEIIEDIMAALAYREDLLPSGYKLVEVPSETGMSNPGFVSEERLARFPEKFGTDVEIQRGYMCNFLDEENRRHVVYFVFELVDNDDAVAIEEAVNETIAEEADAHGDSFALRNYLALVVWKGDAEDDANELMAKLKSAINYTD